MYRRGTSRATGRPRKETLRGKQEEMALAGAWQKINNSAAAWCARTSCQA